MLANVASLGRGRGSLDKSQNIWGAGSSESLETYLPFALKYYSFANGEYLTSSLIYSSLVAFSFHNPSQIRSKLFQGYLLY